MQHEPKKRKRPPGIYTDCKTEICTGNLNAQLRKLGSVVAHVKSSFVISITSCTYDWFCIFFIVIESCGKWTNDTMLLICCVDFYKPRSSVNWQQKINDVLKAEIVKWASLILTHLKAIKYICMSDNHVAFAVYRLWCLDLQSLCLHIAHGYHRSLKIESKFSLAR